MMARCGRTYHRSPYISKYFLVWVITRIEAARPALQIYRIHAVARQILFLLTTSVYNFKYKQLDDLDKPDEPDERAIVSVAFHSRGQFFATGAKDGSITIYDSRDLSIMDVIEDRRPELSLRHSTTKPPWSLFFDARIEDCSLESVVVLAFHPVRPLLAVGYERTKVPVFYEGNGSKWRRYRDNFDYAEFKRRGRGFPGSFRTFVFCGDTTTLIALTTDGTIFIYDIDRLWRKNSISHKQPPSCLAYNAALNVIATGTKHGKVRLCTTRYLRIGLAFRFKILCKEQVHRSAVKALAFHPTLHLLASGSEDNSVAVCTILTGDRNDDGHFSLEKLYYIRTHTHMVQSVSFHPALFLLASVSYDGTILVHDIQPFGGKEIMFVPPPPYTISLFGMSTVAFHPHYPLLAAAVSRRRKAVVVYNTDLFFSTRMQYYAD